MKQIFFCAVIVCLLVSCADKVQKEDLQKLNGYWEIESVKLPDGGTKKYGINETIEFIELKDDKGIRRKVMPQLDGKFIFSPNTEIITIQDSAGAYYISYRTDFATWKEEIVKVSDSAFIVKNNQKLEYHYKKHQKISILPNDETIK
jgi:hypothetical protein